MTVQQAHPQNITKKVLGYIHPFSLLINYLCWSLKWTLCQFTGWNCCKKSGFVGQLARGDYRATRGVGALRLANSCVGRPWARLPGIAAVHALLTVNKIQTLNNNNNMSLCVFMSQYTHICLYTCRTCLVVNVWCECIVEVDHSALTLAQTDGDAVNLG